MFASATIDVGAVIAITCFKFNPNLTDVHDNIKRQNFLFIHCFPGDTSNQVLTLNENEPELMTCFAEKAPFTKKLYNHLVFREVV